MNKHFIFTFYNVTVSAMADKSGDKQCKWLAKKMFKLYSDAQPLF
jgi:hypothetical protein